MKIIGFIMCLRLKGDWVHISIFIREPSFTPSFTSACLMCPVALTTLVECLLFPSHLTQVLIINPNHSDYFLSITNVDPGLKNIQLSRCEVTSLALLL